MGQLQPPALKNQAQFAQKSMGLPLASSVIKFFTVMNHCHSTKVEIGRLGYPLQKTLLKSQWSDLALSTAFACTQQYRCNLQQQINCSHQDNHSLYCIWIHMPHQRSDPPCSSMTNLSIQELAESAVASPVRSWPNKSPVAGSRKGASALLSTNRNTDAQCH